MHHVNTPKYFSPFGPHYTGVFRGMHYNYILCIYCIYTFCCFGLKINLNKTLFSGFCLQFYFNDKHNTSQSIHRFFTILI